MSLSFSQGKIQGEQRRDIVQEVQNKMKAAACAAVKEVVAEFLAAEVTAKLGREKGMVRRKGEPPREIDWACRNCGCHNANQFTRDGHYKRDLQTGWGPLENLRVPMLECQKCHHDVMCNFAREEKNQRFWFDLDQDVFWSSGSYQSVREIAERWSALTGHSVGLRTITDRINQLEQKAKDLHEQTFAEAPDVIQFDGIWLTIQEQGEEIQLDQRNRSRHCHKGKKVVVLVALGFWQNGSKQEILDWQIADSEGYEEWETFLKSLHERGITVKKGLKAIIRDGGGGLGKALDLIYGNQIIDQRCIFHKLKNVRDACRSELKGDEHRAEKGQLMQQASAIYDASSAAAAREQLAAWANAWRPSAPKSVATLERDFEATIAYFRLEGINRQWVRSTSLLERANLKERRKFRQALAFGSQAGAEAALYLQVQRLHARWHKQQWWEVSHDLYFDLTRPNP